VPVVRAFARGAFFVFACVAVLLGSALTLIASTVGVCAAVGFLLYGLAHLVAYVFGVSFRWGLVSACGLLFLGVTGGALINDLWMIRKLSPARVSAPSLPGRRSVTAADEL
jgi:hypothetical protein